MEIYMNGKLKITAAALTAAVAVMIFAACNKPLTLKGDAIEIPSSYAYELDNSVRFLGLDGALLENPDRGLRAEVYITLGGNSAYPSDGRNAFEYLDEQLALYADDGIKVAQVYVYLVQYCDREIPASALEEMKLYFESIRERGIKMVLRFAYEYTSGDKRGPTDDIIEKHCGQLKAFFSDNAELTAATLHAMQLGFVGLWGEGHGANKKHDFTRVIKAVCDMTPDPYSIMVRTADIYMRAPESLKSRLTIHDDFLVGIPGHDWSLSIDFDTREYAVLKTINYGGVCDGEMPWGRDTTVPDISHIAFLRQASDLGLTTLSAAHNYKEGGGAYHLERWKNVFLRENELREHNLPFNKNLLTDGKISVYEYLRYHLGYQLAASDFSYADGKISFMLTNFGFAAPHGFRLSCVINGEEVSVPGFAAADLNRFGQRVYTVNCADLQSFGLKFTHARDASAHIRLANAVPYENGVNIIYTV
jgi:hypothetical protein